MNDIKEVMTNLGFRNDFDLENRLDIKTPITYEGTEYLVSTVDLGLNHAMPEQEPLYYETIIFHEETGNVRYLNRYATGHQAVQGHEHIIENFNLYIR